MSVRIGLDVGGTFTDLEAVDTTSGARVHRKVPSRPEDPAAGILAAVDAVLCELGAPAARVSFVGHGTTVVTNMLIERTGARLTVVTTRGFRDILALGRQARPNVYDYRVRRPEPLARRAHRYEVTERIAADGRIRTPLDEDAVRALAARLADFGAIAVCFLNAHINPAHERAAAAILSRALPNAFVTTSHEAAAEMREFERFSTAAVNAFVGPGAARYFARLSRGLSERGAPAAPYTVTSNGALVDEASAVRRPVTTALSGPAAGVTGIGRLLADHAIADLITFDVGGTSTDIAVVTDGAPRMRLDREVAGHPILAPTADIDVVGAGGGSLARLDGGGTLTVGPQSAGADPGPVAYGRGGTVPTLTDAALVLGRLPDAMRLGGTLVLDRSAAAGAVERTIAAPLDTTAEEAAAGILAVAAANMARTIRSAVVQRGFALPRFTLAAYGGAGPLLACDVAAALGLTRIVVPTAPGTLCARAALSADIARDFAHPLAATLDGPGLALAADALAALARDGAAWLAREGVAPAQRESAAQLDLRYAGQSFALTLPHTPGEPKEATREAFHAAHARERGFRLEDRRIEIVAARLRAFAPTAPLPPTAFEASACAPTSRRTVVFDGTPVATPILPRERLAGPLEGPAILEEATSTTVVAPSWRATAAGDGTLFLTRIDA